MNKYVFIKLLLFLMSLLTCRFAIAGIGSGAVQIEYVGNWKGKDLVFFYTRTHNEPPDCNIHRKRWVLDLSTDLGKSQYSLLLTAQASQKPIVVRGADSCNLWSNSETATVVGFAVDFSINQ